MILTRNEIREAVDKGEIKFSPALEEKQWGGASVDLRLGYRFTKLKKSDHKIPLAKGLSQIADLWHEEIFAGTHIGQISWTNDSDREFHPSEAWP
jgi:deoxycytidine triphosphate deaminase